MDVKFIQAKRSLIDTIPINDGQIIASRDECDFFYDSNSRRNRIGPTLWESIKDNNSEYTSGFMITDPNVSVIQFVPNGGNDIVVQESTSIPNFVIGKTGQNIPYTLLPTPVREGYKFLGWYEDQMFLDSPVETFPARYIQGKTIYYASWLKLTE